MKSLLLAVLAFTVVGANCAHSCANDETPKLSVFFAQSCVVVVATPDVPVQHIQATIKGLQKSGHNRFALRSKSVGMKKLPRIQIRFFDREAEIAVSITIKTKDLVSVISHLSESGVRRIRFAPPRAKE